MGEKLAFSAILWKEGKLQIAWSAELDVASQGKKGFGFAIKSLTV